MDYRKEYREAEEWAYKELLPKKIFHKEIKDYILFDKSGIDHCINAKSYPLKIKLIYQVEKLLKNSILYSIEPDKKKRPDILRIIRLVSKIKLLGVEYFVYIVIRQKKNGHYYYDNGILKEKPL